MILNYIDVIAKTIVIGGVGYFIGSYIQKKSLYESKKNIIKKTILEMDAKYMNEFLKIFFNEIDYNLKKEES